MIICKRVLVRWRWWRFVGLWSLSVSILTRVRSLKSPLEFVKLTRVNEYYSSLELPAFRLASSFFVSLPLPKSFGHWSFSSSPLQSQNLTKSQLYLRRSRNVEGGIVGFSSCAGGSGSDGRLPCLARLRYTSPSQAHCYIYERWISTTMGLLYDDCMFLSSPFFCCGIFWV